MNELDLQPTPPSAWDEDRNVGSESPTGNRPLQQHPETDNGRWELTTATVGPTPARLTLTGVGSDAATMDTFISAVSCQREKNQSNQEHWHKKNNNTAVTHPRLTYHLKTTRMLPELSSILPSVPLESTVEANNSPFHCDISKFLHFYCLILLHTKLEMQCQGKLSNPHFKNCFGGSQIYPPHAGKRVCGETNHEASYEDSNCGSMDQEAISCI